MPRRRDRRRKGINVIDVRRDGIVGGIATGAVSSLSVGCVSTLYDLYDASAIIGGANEYIATGAVNALDTLMTAEM